MYNNVYISEVEISMRSMLYLLPGVFCCSVQDFSDFVENGRQMYTCAFCFTSYSSIFLLHNIIIANFSHMQLRKERDSAVKACESAYEASELLKEQLSLMTTERNLARQHVISFAPALTRLIDMTALILLLHRWKNLRNCRQDCQHRNRYCK